MKLYNNIFHNKKLIRELLKQADMFNTLNGGIISTAVDIVSLEESIVIKIFAPSMDVESFNILLSYTKLTISIFAKQEKDEQKIPVFIPVFIQTFDVPPTVDVDRIEAIHKNDELHVILPYRESNENMQRLIEVKKF